MDRFYLVFPLAAAVACSSPSQPSPSPASVPSISISSFTLDGFVHDTGLRVLPDAVVEILDGPRAGETTRTDASGRFWFPSEFSEQITLRASKPGHQDATMRTTPSGAHAHVNLDLELVEPPLNISGEYSLIVTGGPACLAVPEPYRTRSYDVTIARYTEPYLFRVQFRDLNVLDVWNPTIQLHMAGSYMQMIADGDWRAGIIEDVPSGWITFFGSSHGMMTSSGVSGSFTPGGSGYMYCPGPRPGKGTNGTTWDCPTMPSYCPSSDLRYSLQRR